MGFQDKIIINLYKLITREKILNLEFCKVTQHSGNLIYIFEDIAHFTDFRNFDNMKESFNNHLVSCENYLLQSKCERPYGSSNILRYET